MRAILFFLAIALTGSAAAQTYKWTDDRGVTTYGSKPPAGRPAQLVDTHPQGPADLSREQQKKLEADARRRADVPPPPPGPRPPAAATARGMAFDTYIRLERGMSESELVQRAGAPDQVSVDHVQHGVARLYYYLPTAHDPFTTVVTVRGGRIDQLERIRKF